MAAASANSARRRAFWYWLIVVVSAACSSSVGVADATVDLVTRTPDASPTDTVIDVPANDVGGDDAPLDAGCSPDLLTDPLNCGTCGHACCRSEFCVNGFCYVECRAGLAGCYALGPECGVCADLATDMRNCGACGAACVPVQRCVGGRCTP